VAAAVAGAVALVLLGGSRGSHAPTTTAPGSTPLVIVYGDSLVAQAAPYLASEAGGLGLRVTVHALGGTAPCDFLPVLRSDIAAGPVGAVVWAFSGNSIGTCMLDRSGTPLTGAAAVAKYRTDTETAINLAEAHHVPFVVASGPAPRASSLWAPLDILYRELAAAHHDTAYLDAGQQIAPDGQFAETQTCLPAEYRINQPGNTCYPNGGTVVVRSPDGTHFCQTRTTVCPMYASGAWRYATNLLSGARLELDAVAASAHTN